MLNAHGKRDWLTIIVMGLMLMGACLWVGWWWTAGASVFLTVAVLSFFRDPDRHIATDRHVVVSPADGRISSIHRVEHFEPFGEPAVCVRIFLSVLNVHVNRSPCHGLVQSIIHRDGQHLSALNPKSAEENEWNLIVLRHPVRGHKVAAIRQVAGRLARTIHCALRIEQIVQRGQRIGIISLGSTTELYVPDSRNPQIVVRKGQKVMGGTTVLARLTLKSDHYDEAAGATIGTEALVN